MVVVNRVPATQKCFPGTDQHASYHTRVAEQPKFRSFKNKQITKTMKINVRSQQGWNGTSKVPNSKRMGAGGYGDRAGFDGLFAYPSMALTASINIAPSDSLSFISLFFRGGL